MLDGSPQCLAIQALGCVLPVELFARCEDLAHMSYRSRGGLLRCRIFGATRTGRNDVRMNRAT